MPQANQPEHYQDGSGPQKTRASFTFAGEDVLTVTVADPGVHARSVILATAGVPTSREGDELEMDPLIISVGTITPGTGFDLYVHPGPGSAPEGDYLALVHRW